MTVTLPNRSEFTDFDYSAPDPAQRSAQGWGAAPPSADPADFQTRLFSLVEEEMDRLTSVNALDEWHVNYLDERIDSEVRQEQLRLADLASSRRIAMNSGLVALRATIDQLVSREESARAQVVVARTELGHASRSLALAQGTPPEAAGGQTAHPAAMARIAEDSDPKAHRKNIRRALRRLRVRSEPHLAAKLEAARLTVADLEQRIEEQQSALDMAKAERIAAHDRFRGVAPSDLRRDISREHSPTAQTAEATPSPFEKDPA